MDARSINDYLKRWGRTPYGGPLMRLVWSNSQRETRIGTFDEFSGNIYLRTITGAREVPKYSWLKDRWLLERWYPAEVVHNPELPMTNEGSYEPVYVFEDSQGNALPLVLRVVELVCEHMFNRPPEREKGRVLMQEESDRRDKAESVEIEDALDTSVIAGQLHLGEAVTVPEGVPSD